MISTWAHQFMFRLDFRRETKVMPAPAATYTWTYSPAFTAGVVPVCSGIVQVGLGNTDMFNVQVIGAPTNTQCTFQITRVSPGLLALLLGALSFNAPVANTLHMMAVEP